MAQTKVLLPDKESVPEKGCSLGVRACGISLRGKRANNEDRYLTDLDQNLFLVADGLGGQDKGELASGLAMDIIPRVVEKELATLTSPGPALLNALQVANQAIGAAGKSQSDKQRMATTVVCALYCDNHVFVTNLGDSRAYLIRNCKVEQLTADHTMAQIMVTSGSITPEQARFSTHSNVLTRFLGQDFKYHPPEVKSFTPRVGDYLLLATDGLTNWIENSDLCGGPDLFPNLLKWAEYLVNLALKRGSRDNVTCLVVEFIRP